MAEPLSRSLTDDYAEFIGEVTSQSAVKGDPDTLRYGIVLRNVRDRNMVHHLTNYKINSLFKGVEVVAATVGSPAWGRQTPRGLYVFAYEQVEFTENCE